MIGAIFAIPVTDAAEDESFAGQVQGVFELDKVSTQVWVPGERAYWKASADEVSNLPTDGQLVGFIVEDAANPTATGKVLLVQGAELSEGPQAAVADVATADAAGAAYGQPEEDLLNEIKAQFNALLARLRLAGIIAT